MGTRRESRERALELCYEVELRHVDPDVALAEVLADNDVVRAARRERGEPLDELLLEAPPVLDPYVLAIVRGVEDRHEEIDALLRKFSEHWALERMPVVDRTLLRVGCFELLATEEPTAAVINEAVELAKEYSTKDSGRFVNGLLSRIAEDVRGRAAE